MQDANLLISCLPHYIEYVGMLIFFSNNSHSTGKYIPHSNLKKKMQIQKYHPSHYCNDFHTKYIKLSN